MASFEPATGIVRAAAIPFCVSSLSSIATVNKAEFRLLFPKHPDLLCIAIGSAVGWPLLVFGADRIVLHNMERTENVRSSERVARSQLQRRPPPPGAALIDGLLFPVETKRLLRAAGNLFLPAFFVLRPYTMRVELIGHFKPCMT